MATTACCRYNIFNIQKSSWTRKLSELYRTKKLNEKLLIESFFLSERVKNVITHYIQENKNNDGHVIIEHDKSHVKKIVTHSE